MMKQAGCFVEFIARGENKDTNTYARRLYRETQSLLLHNRLIDLIIIHIHATLSLSADN